MLKKVITYTDFDGNERTESFYFNFTQAEIAEMELTQPGGFANHIQKIVDAAEYPDIVKLFKEIILKAYGEKDDTGRRFVKSKELSEAFSQTEAYSKLFIELATDDKAAADFVNAIIPKDVVEQDKPALTQTTQE